MTWWQRAPLYREVAPTAFDDPRWQLRHTLRRPEQLAALLQPLVADSLLAPALLEDLLTGLARAQMTLGLTPQLLAGIDWRDPVHDPIRRQFLPLASEQRPDHPACRPDALAERRDSPLPGLVRRYPDRALLLALDTCPVYCRFCTRSYLVGGATAALQKQALPLDRGRHADALAWLRAHPEVQDVVVSGGDAALLPPRRLAALLDGLLALPQLKRLRVATRALSAVPQLLRPEQPWGETLLGRAATARQRGVELALHIHVNHPRELVGDARRVLELYFRAGLTVRNQSVLLAGVNDDSATMGALLRQLADLHVRPYYVYLADLVPGQEALRTTLGRALELEAALRGSIAGFHMPLFVVDLEGGGGKRDVHAFEDYDREHGVARYRAPAVSDRVHHWYDPIHLLPAAGQSFWTRSLKKAVARTSPSAGSTTGV